MQRMRQLVAHVDMFLKFSEDDHMNLSDPIREILFGKFWALIRYHQIETS